MLSIINFIVKPVGCLIFGYFKLCSCEDYCTFLLLYTYRRRSTGLKCICSFNTLEANAYCFFQDSCRTLPSYQEFMKVVFNFSYSGGYVMFSCSFNLHFSDDWQDWVVFICIFHLMGSSILHLCIDNFFCKVLISGSCSFFYWFIFVLLICRSSFLYSMDRSFFNWIYAL